MEDSQITPEMVQSWKDMKVQICMYIRSGEYFWLVPEYTNKDRAEISIDDYLKQAAAIKKILEVFPDAKVATVIKPKEQKVAGK